MQAHAPFLILKSVNEFYIVNLLICLYFLRLLYTVVFTVVLAELFSSPVTSFCGVCSSLSIHTLSPQLLMYKHVFNCCSYYDAKICFFFHTSDVLNGTVIFPTTLLWNRHTVCKVEQFLGYLPPLTCRTCIFVLCDATGELVTLASRKQSSLRTLMLEKGKIPLASGLIVVSCGTPWCFLELL